MLEREFAFFERSFFISMYNMLTKPVVVDELCIKKVSEVLFIKNGIFI